MKLSAHFYVVITSLLLALVAVMVFYNLPYNAVFFTVLLGQAWWLFTVYKVLTDKYSTNKTFDDWYEDHPVGKE
ncbi:hypothetical protein JRG66_05435 [Salinimicrobium tongyeongense]|uniref:Uncharacterized protein n=1 Tax=Salinimicrobium tongyeongense TaxID=2809707 RepID=A0ABY6NUZ1_9FLAO|nr:hypothetical protein [Salinimicrobium tongyeongense]UZH56308.1 hypothetical protein JRG66_05435 [Salinimicrobium tongyeongense]